MGYSLWKVLARFMGFIAICFLMVGLLLTSIEWVAFDIGHYDRQYKKLGISQSTGISQDDLLVTTGELLNYIRGKREDLKVQALVHGQERLVFNQREIQHMVDVRDLFALGFKLRWISFGAFGAIIALLVGLRKKHSLRDLSISYLVALSLLVAFSLMLLGFIFLDFTSLWTRFHHIFFTNDLWLLDPDTDILIQMVPEEFFFNTIMKILGFFGSLLLVLGIYSGIVVGKNLR